MTLKLFSRRTIHLALLGAPLLLLMPAVYYSLTTPFSLVDDYLYGEDLREVLFFEEADGLSSWLHRNFLSSEISRFRPLWELANGFALTTYGAKPSLHHLSRWLLHFASVAMFVLALATILRPERGSASGARALGSVYSPALPMSIALMAHVWLFFPNSPVSRLQPQEIQTVIFLGLCNWMAALMLVEPGSTSPVRAYITRILFCLGCLGLSWSKEVNIGVAACLFAFQIALLLWRNQRTRLEMASSMLLFAIVVFAALRVYAASHYAGVGYGADFTTTVLFANAKLILGGLFQGRTSALIAVGFIGLGLSLLIFLAKRWRTCGLDSKLFFLAFLLIQGVAMFLTLCSSYDVALRYWYPLIPLLSMAMAFATYFLVSTAEGRTKAAVYTVKVCLALFIGFYIACNYSNFLFQTVLQHSFGNLEERVVQEATYLLENGEPVWITRTGDEYEDKLIGHFNEGSFFTVLDTKRYFVHTKRPVVLPYYYHVSRSAPATPSVLIWSADNRRRYDAFSMASTVAAFLQGGDRHLSRDAGVASFDAYRWSIYRVNGEERPLLIDAEFDIYFDRHTRSLLYMKSPCDATAARPRFYLHVVAQDKRRYSTERAKRFDVEVLDFQFSNNDCIEQVKLPSFAIYSLSTGRTTLDKTRIWERNFFFHEQPRDVRGAYDREHIPYRSPKCKQTD